MSFLFRLIFTLFGMAFALFFTLGVLCWLALYVVFASVRWLATGQKPQVVMMWQQLQAMRKGMRSQRSDVKSDVVEDVVVREIHDKRELPKD